MTDMRPGVGGQGQPSNDNTGTADPEVLAASLSAIARDLGHHDDPVALLAEIVSAAVALVPGAEEGSISITHGHHEIRSEAPTSELALRVDGLQNETQQGPCLDAAYEHHTVRVEDMGTEQRWPLFAHRARQAGVMSMLALQLYVQGDNLGALNLYARRPGAFTDESEQVGLLFASHAAIAYGTLRKESQLAQALSNRDLIGQAKGILMERFQISGERAFLVLSRASQSSNRKLHEVASELVHSGRTPSGLLHR